MILYDLQSYKDVKVYYDIKKGFLNMFVIVHKSTRIFVMSICFLVMCLKFNRPSPTLTQPIRGRITNGAFQDMISTVFHLNLLVAQNV